MVYNNPSGQETPPPYGYGASTPPLSPPGSMQQLNSMAKPPAYQPPMYKASAVYGQFSQSQLPPPPSAAQPYGTRVEVRPALNCLTPVQDPTRPPQAYDPRAAAQGPPPTFGQYVYGSGAARPEVRPELNNLALTADRRSMPEVRDPAGMQGPRTADVHYTHTGERPVMNNFMPVQAQARPPQAYDPRNAALGPPSAGQYVYGSGAARPADVHHTPAGERPEVRPALNNLTPVQASSRPPQAHDPRSLQQPADPYRKTG